MPSPTGYDFTGAGDTVTTSGFSPGGVSCANGYTGSVTYGVCGSVGVVYSVSGGQAKTCSYTSGTTTTRASCTFDGDSILCKVQRRLHPVW